MNFFKNLFKKEEVKQPVFKRYFISKDIVRFVDLSTKEFFYISKEESDGAIEKYNYAPVVESFSDATTILNMLNDVVDYKSGRYTIMVIVDDNKDLKYTYWDSWDNSYRMYYSVQSIMNHYTSITNAITKHDTFDTSEEIIKYLNSIEVVGRETIEEV